jgi:hypothetical protein
MREVKQNDSRAVIRAQIQDEANRLPLDLTGTTADFTLSRVEPDTGVLVDSLTIDAVIDAPASAGFLHCTLTPEMTAEPGFFLGSFTLYFLDDTQETYPKKGFIEIFVEAGL